MTRASLPDKFRSSVLKTPRLVAKVVFDDTVERIITGVLPDRPRLLNVVFPLRPDFSINFSIPCDFTEREAERLSNFAKTLFLEEGYL